MSEPSMAQVLRNRKLAQFGDCLLNFSYSLALTRATKQPIGLKVKDRTLASAAVKAGLRQHLPRRVDAGEVANSLEALVGHVFLQDRLKLEELVERLTPRELDDGDESKPFLRLAQLALERMQRESC